jgi:hypothetical protein
VFLLEVTAGTPHDFGDGGVRCHSLRFYFLGDKWKGRVEHVGAKPSYDPQGPLVV